MPTPDPGPPAANDDLDDELLDTGQEEVFSRTEVEMGVGEHGSESGKTGPDLGRILPAPD